jgi:hypothetical protein
LPSRYAGVAPGAYALRAAAELYGRDWAGELYGGDRRTELAGRRLTVACHRGWLSAFRMTHTDGLPRTAQSQTEVVVALDTVRRIPALVTVTVPGNEPSLLPGVNAIARSLGIAR